MATIDITLDVIALVVVVVEALFSAIVPDSGGKLPHVKAQNVRHTGSISTFCNGEMRQFAVNSRREGSNQCFLLVKKRSSTAK